MERDGLNSHNIRYGGLLPEEELRICWEKLNDLGKDIENFDYSNKENEYKRISSRLCHIQQRLGRIEVSGRQWINERDEVMARCYQLIDAVGAVRDGGNIAQAQKNILDQENRAEVSILDTDNPLLPEITVSKGDRGRSRPEENDNGVQNSTMVQMGLEMLGDLEEVGGRMRQAQLEMRDLLNTHPAATRTADRRSGVSFRETERRSCQSTGPRHPPQGFVENTNAGVAGSPTYQYQGGLEEALDDIRAQLRNLHRPSFSGYEQNEFRSPNQFVDVSRWRIVFDGDSSVANFLERIEELRVSRGVEKAQLLQCAPELFSKDALIWLRTKDFKTWEELTEQLKIDFQPCDYEFELWEELRRRTQGSRERTITFISAMENMFKKLGTNRPTETTRVKHIRRNLLPHIQSQLALHKTETIAELTTLCKAIEETDLRAQKFQPPPTNYRQLLEPELAYRKPAHQVSSSHSPVATLEVSQNPNSSDGTNPRYTPSSPICWNCGKTGHRFKKCTEPRKIFCFRCGLENVIAKRCPNCTKNLDACSKKTG